MKKIVNCPVFHNYLFTCWIFSLSNLWNKLSVLNWTGLLTPQSRVPRSPLLLFHLPLGWTLDWTRGLRSQRRGQRWALPPSHTPPTSPPLLCSSHSILIPVSLGPHHFHTCHCFPSSNGLYSFDSESSFSYFFLKGRYPETWSNTVMLVWGLVLTKGYLESFCYFLPFMVNRW